MNRYPAEQYRAWERISHLRSCPPLDLLRARGSAVEQHLKGCAYCRGELENLEIYVAAIDKLKFGEGDQQPVQEPLPGQIREVLRSAADSIEVEGRFYNPPLVLICDVQTGIPGMVRVAQIHDEPALLWTGDICLQKPYENNFAESWNYYPVFSDNLSPPLGQVAPDIVEAVITEAAKPLLDVPVDSPLLSFRRQEVDTGAFFSRNAVARALEWLEQSDRNHATVIYFSKEKNRITKQPKKQASSRWSMAKPKTWGAFAAAASICIVIASGVWEPGGYKGSSKDILAAMSMMAKQSAADVVRGGQGIFHQPFPWEYGTVIPPLRWQHYAVGQVRARSEVFSELPAALPDAWQLKATAVSVDSAAYVDLGILAYGVDLACKRAETPDKKVLQTMREQAEKLKKHIKSEDNAASDMIQELLRNRPSCEKLNGNLNDIETAYR